MSDEKESTGGWVQAVIAFIKKSPWGAAYIAKGEVAAMKIKADGMVEIMEKHAGHDVSWKKGNLESISRKSEEYMSQDGREEKAKNLSREWAATFADKCGNISDEDMQSLWAKILAGEVDNSGTFSKKTLSVLSDMNKKDAELFTSLCQFVWRDDEDNFIALIYHDDHQDKRTIYESKGITFEALNLLESMGLVRCSFGAPLFAENLDSDHKTWHYHNMPVEIRAKVMYPKTNRYHIPIGQVLLTQMGKQLVPVSDVDKNNEFFNYVIAKWKKDGFDPIIQPPAAK